MWIIFLVVDICKTPIVESSIEVITLKINGVFNQVWCFLVVFTKAGVRMKIGITYCGMWNYLPMASRLKAEIEQRFETAMVELIESSGGVFEITKDSDLIFSKKSEGRFPEDEEIFEKL